jgi:hypothetical protein
MLNVLSYWRCQVKVPPSKMLAESACTKTFRMSSYPCSRGNREITERRILNTFKHPHMVALVGSCIDPLYISLIKSSVADWNMAEITVLCHYWMSRCCRRIVERLESTIQHKDQSRKHPADFGLNRDSMDYGEQYKAHQSCTQDIAY